MRAPLSVRLALALLLGLAPLPAAAGVLVGASLALELGVLPGVNLGPVTFVGVGVSGSSSGSLYATLAAGTAFAGTLGETTSGASPVTGISFIVGANGAGIFSGPAPSLVGGSMPIEADVCVKLFSQCDFYFADIPFGTSQTVVLPPFPGVGITMIGSPWTAGTAAIYVLPTTASGTGTTTTRMGSNGLNAKGAGTLVLVSSVNFLTTVAGQLPSFATLTLQYVPEPGALAWVAPGVAALGLVAHRLRVGRRREAR